MGKNKENKKNKSKARAVRPTSARNGRQKHNSNRRNRRNTRNAPTTRKRTSPASRRVNRRVQPRDRPRYRSRAKLLNAKICRKCFRRIKEALIHCCPRERPRRVLPIQRNTPIYRPRLRNGGAKQSKSAAPAMEGNSNLPCHVDIFGQPDAFTATIDKINDGPPTLLKTWLATHTFSTPLLIAKGTDPYYKEFCDLYANTTVNGLGEVISTQQEQDENQNNMDISGEDFSPENQQRPPQCFRFYDENITFLSCRNTGQSLQTASEPIGVVQDEVSLQAAGQGDGDGPHMINKFIGLRSDKASCTHQSPCDEQQNPYKSLAQFIKENIETSRALNLHKTGQSLQTESEAIGIMKEASSQSAALSAGDGPHMINKIDSSIISDDNTNDSGKENENLMDTTEDDLSPEEQQDPPKSLTQLVKHNLENGEVYFSNILEAINLHETGQSHPTESAPESDSLQSADLSASDGPHTVNECSSSSVLEISISTEEEGSSNEEIISDENCRSEKS